LNYFIEIKFNFLEQQINSLPIINKQKSLPQNLKSLPKLKEKSASHHMTLAEKKLNHFQKYQLSTISTTSNINSPSSSTQSKPKENNKIPPKVHLILIKIIT